MGEESLVLTGGGSGLQALVARAVGLDATAAVRVRQRCPDEIEVFVTTPFEVVAARRAKGSISRDGAVVGGQAMLTSLEAVDVAVANDVHPLELSLGPARDPSWPGALPPESGFTLLEELPVTVVRELADEGRKLARQFSGPMGPPQSLLNQSVVTAEAGEHKVEIPMRMIFACTNLGLIPGFSAPMDIPRHLRVAGNGRWVRVDAPFGSVYHSTRLSLF